ncbi:MAG: hypothetical protein V4539_14430 [Bacteroidota bacterium]
MKKSFLLTGFLCCFFMIAQAQEGAKDSSVLKEYAGKYVFPDGSVIPNVVVKLEDGALTMTSAAGTSPLIKDKEKEDLYNITSFNGTAKFNRDANKKIIGVSVDARGYLLEGTKTVETASIQLQKKEFVINHSFITFFVR